MVTAITAPRGSRTGGQQLSEFLQERHPETGVVWLADLDRAHESLSGIDSIILIHEEPNESLYAFIEQTKAIASTLPIVVWGVPECPEMVSKYLISGAMACFLDGHDPNDLAEALQAVRDGEYYLPPIIQRLLISAYVEISGQVIRDGFGRLRDPDGLTEREQEVLSLLVAGHTNPEIAKRLFLEVGTVKNHVHHILTKLDVADRRAAARYFETRQRFVAA